MGTVSNVNDTHWDVGKQWAGIIRPFAEQRKYSRAAMLEAANKLQKNTLSTQSIKEPILFL